MNFTDFKKAAENITANQSASLADYLSCAARSTTAQELPWYVRKARIAILCSFTIRGLGDVLRVVAASHNISAHIYEMPYGQFTQEALDHASRLYGFKPQLIYLIAENKDFLDEKHRDSVLGALGENSSAQIIFSDFDGKIGERYRVGGRITPFSFSQFLSRVGKEKYWNTKYEKIGDMRLMPAVYPALARALMPYAIAASGATKKCLVTDLDNTLWQGIVGEEGLERIEPRHDLQEYILGLRQNGIILAINSRNNSEDAMAVLERHPGMILRKGHFAAWRINWQGKDKNMVELAGELNLGMESFVLVDDDPFQRNLVKTSFPETAVLSPKALISYPGFYSFRLTEEDAKRGELYAREGQRKELEKHFKTPEEFLRVLELRVSVRRAADTDIPRVSQLTQKTNQFNLTTRRYSEEDILRFIKRGWSVWTAEANDKFGDYGVIGVCMAESRDVDWRIDNFLLSCRVLGRGVEQAFLGKVMEEAKQTGITKIVGEFIPTAKNKPCETFFKEAKFSLIKSKGASQFYEFPLSERAYKMPDYVKVI